MLKLLGDGNTSAGSPDFSPGFCSAVVDVAEKIYTRKRATFLTHKNSKRKSLEPDFHPESNTVRS